jgi:hypothetical protein
MIIFDEVELKNELTNQRTSRQERRQGRAIAAQSFDSTAMGWQWSMIMKAFGPLKN